MAEMAENQGKSGILVVQKYSSTTMALTQKQRELLNYLEDYIEQNRQSPSLREQANAMGLKSVAPIQSRLNALRKQNYVTWIPGKPRTLKILKPTPKKGVPVVGAIAAGWMETFSDEPTTSIPFQVFESFGRSKQEVSQYFAVRVYGTSMIESHIAPGDVVILKPPQDPKNIKDGAIVAAMVDGRMTLKHYEKVNAKTIRLNPASPDYKPIDVAINQIQIQGVYVGALRDLV